MKSFFTLVLFAFVLLFTSMLYPQQLSDIEVNTIPIEGLYVIPPEYAGTPGTATFLGPLSSSARTYQFLINESLLTNVVGMEISGVSFRIPTSATANWPTADVTFSNYDIYLSQSVPPANRSLTFALNVAGTQTLVRSGSLVVSRDAYLFGSSPNPFGSEITFNAPWLYNGGHLLIELRHSGFTGTSRSTDAIGTSITGYGTLFSACWATGYTAVSGSQGNFTVIQLNASNPIPVELMSFTSEVSNRDVILNWATATETNNRGFEIERFSSDSWVKVGFVKGAGTTTEQNVYSFADKNLLPDKYSYRLKQVDFDGIFSYSNEVEAVVTQPLNYVLNQNYPNPFNPTTKISWQSPISGRQLLKVFDMLGNEIATLLNEEIEAGYHSVAFDADNLPSGIYFYQLKVGSYVETKMMMLLQ